jgi:hypothetical protein
VPVVVLKCLCGFAELSDETFLDHLNSVFVPDNVTGIDGMPHEEGRRLACACGFAAIAPGELDTHFLRVFTPDDGIGRDGNKHLIA